MLKMDFVGGWGHRAATRPEVVAASARMLTMMPVLPAGRWTRFVERPGSAFMDAVPVDIEDPESVGSAIELRSRSGALGLRIHRQADPTDYPLAVTVRAGNTLSHNRLVVEARFPEESETVRAAVGEHMTAMIRAWDPDWLKAGTYEFHGAQKEIGLQPGQIVLGWSTYLSARVPLDVGLLGDGVTVIPERDGATSVVLGGTMNSPSLQDAVSVRRALGYG